MFVPVEYSTEGATHSKFNGLQHNLEFDTPESRAAGYAEFFYDGNHFPFNDATYDVVVSNQVLEYVFNPDEFLNEIFRILKPEGKVLLSVPFVWDEHLQPLDYARYSSF